MPTLIRNATVITVDAAQSVHSPGALVVADGRIVDVGADSEVTARWPDADNVIDAAGKVVLPGFVSAHNHLGYSVFRGRAEDLGYNSTHRLYLPMSAVISHDERRVIGSLAIAELLRGGVTTVLEMEEDADLFAPFLEQVGMRALIGIMVNDLDIARLDEGKTVFDPGARERQLDQATSLVRNWHGRANGRLQGVLAATGLSTSSPALLRGLRDSADQLGVRLSIHLGFGEREHVRQVHGAPQFEFAREMGMLADDVTAVHCYEVDDDEMRVLTDSGAHLAHCPLMNQFRGEIARIQDYRERGMNVGLGIDNYFSDYFDVLRACLASARIRAGRPDVLSAPEVLALGTVGAARAIGLDEQIGSLEKGKKADLQIVDMRRYGLTPVNDPVTTLVYHGHAKDVEAVMIDGQWVVRDGSVVGIDEASLIEQAGDAANAAWARFAERHGSYAAPAPV